jgi:hypothetical protein
MNIGGFWRVAAVAAIVLSLSGCATHYLWLKGIPPVLEIYTTAEVRIYRLGMQCRLEVITKTDTVITLPTRCLTVPHVPK